MQEEGLPCLNSITRALWCATREMHQRVALERVVFVFFGALHAFKLSSGALKNSTEFN
jgi:hypothetical protein